MSALAFLPVQEGQVATRSREFGYLVVIGQEADIGHDCIQVHFKEVDRTCDVVVVEGLGMEFAEVAENLAVFDVAGSFAGWRGAKSDTSRSA